MGRLLLRGAACAAVASSLFFLGGCGGHPPQGPSLFPAKVTLSPTPSFSLQVGGVLSFTASAQNDAGSTISPTFTFTSSNTDVLNLAANGVACAGKWDGTFTVCTPGNSGTVQVTASAFGVSSAPTLIYVHPPIDSIKITEVAPVTSPPPACPGQQVIPAACAVSFTATASKCMSTNQIRTLQANAFSKGVDITGVVGPFTWSQTNTAVTKLTPITTSSDNTPTSQATVAPSTPGFTPVFATASGVTSQPYYAETCPVQCIALDMETATSGQTSFSTTKGTPETIIATAVDVQGCIVPKPALTWSSSEPAAVAASTACSGSTTCSATTIQAGSASITASCTPPTCNIGFPQAVVGLPQVLIQPQPVYPVVPISGSVSGASTATSVLASTLDCALLPLCTVNLYNISSTGTIAGVPTLFPTAPNSLLFDAAGDRAYVGSNFGAQVVTAANIGGTTSPFSSLGTVTGKVLAVSANGGSAVFSDTFRIPNEVFVVASAGTSSNSIPFSITGATGAGFAPDGLKAFIVGASGTTCTAPACLYIYSTLQALQTIPLPGASASSPPSGVAFSANGAFGFVAGGANNALTAYALCDNSLAATIPLPSNPTFLKTLPDGIHLIGLDSTGFDYITTTVHAAPFPSQCPQTITGSSEHISLNQGTFTPLDFFVSGDGSTIYVIASDRSSILVYNFNTTTVTGIPLANSSTGQSVSPVAGSMSVDRTLIYVAGTDGALHQIDTVSGADLLQIPFPPASGLSTEPFCPTNGPDGCIFNLVAVKP
jgi:hypothetical protein